MPVLGLGTSVNPSHTVLRFAILTKSFQFSYTAEAPDPTEVENTVKVALQLGYRHIDCAPVYQDEAAVGRGIKASGIPREELFVGDLSVSSPGRILK